MSWIKRNLFFLIGSLVALILMGLAGWFLYSKWNENNEMLASLDDDYDQLKTLNRLNPHPGPARSTTSNWPKTQRRQLRGLHQENHALLPAHRPHPRFSRAN